MTEQQVTGQDPRLSALLQAEPYWIARTMQEQGSAFFQKLGEALARVGAVNRRKIYESWTAELHDFYQRGLLLAQQDG